jgi:dyslexia susceptibility 1 candidate gene 1 protein
MGFITPTHAWEETDAEVTVRVDIKGVPRSSLDVFASSCYLKVNAPPYLFSCDLEGEIDDAACVATVDAAGVAFRCPKLVPGTTWGRLRRETGGPSPEARAATAERRRASVEAAHARVTAEKKAASERKAQVDKAYLEKQWALERTRRETIERRQEEEMAEERERLRRWQEEGDARAAAGVLSYDSGEDVEYDSDDDAETRAAKQKRTRVAREREFADAILTPDAVAAAERENGATVQTLAVPDAALEKMLVADDGDDEAAETARRSKRAAEAKAKATARARADAAAARSAERARSVPPPARRRARRIGFTKLETDHMPARASREREIREWKRSQSSSDANAGRNGVERLDVTEREPVFLKDKGDAFFKAGDYRSALEAYARAADAERAAPHPDGVLIKILANRAACLLRAGHHDAAAEDCAEALAMLHAESTDEDKGAVWPPDKQRAMRFKLLVRRADARAGAGDAAAAAEDLASAAPLAPDDDARAKIDADLEEARACLVPLDAVAARERGDARYRAGDVRGAASAYDAALAMPFRSGEDAAESAAEAPRRSARRSSPTARRATCLCPTTAPRTTTARRGWTRCCRVRRFTRTPRARARWRRTPSEAASAARARASALAKLVHRRAAAAAHLRRFEDAALDYEAASALATDAASRETLERDAETVRAAGRGEVSG